MWKLLAVVLMTLGIASAEEVHPTLALVPPAPDFALPGVDGQIHKLSDYASSPILVVIFTCNHCPIAQMYEKRIQQLATDYKDKGVAVVAIQGNDPKAIRIDELDSSDLSDTLPEMKIRVQYKHLTYPYLYDGDTQKVTRAYGPRRPRTLSSSINKDVFAMKAVSITVTESELVKTQDARNAIDALLAHKEVAVKHTGVFGCSTKWREKAAGREAALEKINEQPVTVQMISKAELTKLRTNPTHQMMLIDFWGDRCGSCITEFADLQDTLRMYGARDYSMVTVSANMPDEQPSVLRFLQKKHATSRNYLFDSQDTASLQAAFDPKWTLPCLIPFSYQERQSAVQAIGLSRHARAQAIYLGQPALGLQRLQSILEEQLGNSVLSHGPMDGTEVPEARN